MSVDPYADWDAAYVLGSLSPLERREYERHLAECESCTTAVAELAGLPGLLAKVPVTDAIAIPSVDSEIPVPATLLPRLIRSVNRRRRQTRGIVAGVVVASAAAAAAVALVIPLIFPTAPPSATTAPTAQFSLSQVVQSPITATAELSTVTWGTRIDMVCSYAMTQNGWDGSSGAPRSYAMYVIDQTGASTEIATWTATPGSTVEPSGTTSLAVGEIRSVQVRATDSGQVLLEGKPA